MITIESLQNNMLIQFWQKPNITALLKTYSAQFDALKQCFADLVDLRTLKTAEGTQLDGIGSIVVLSRLITLSSKPFFGFAGQQNTTGFSQAPLRWLGDPLTKDLFLTDAEYRSALLLKIAKNTTQCTIEELIALYQTLLNTKIILSEQPCVINLSFGRKLTDFEIALISAIGIVIKPAGVRITVNLGG